MSICPEKGLHEQKYRCRDCRCRIAIDPTSSVAGCVQARLCLYTGYYYCPGKFSSSLQFELN